MRDTLEAFLDTSPEASRLVGSKHSETIAVFAFFLSEIAGKPITAANIEACYDAARLKAPKNVSDVLSKSNRFLKTKDGWILHRDSAMKLGALSPKSAPAEANSADDDSRRRTVMVAYGRDEATRLDVFNFLRCIDLQPIEWNDVVLRTGKASPYVGEILNTAFTIAQAFLVLLTPDEEVVLRRELRADARDGQPTMQARPNVILEAGMALATDEGRTILVSIGAVRGMSDLDGRHVVRLNNSAERRNDLVQRLKVAGCRPKTDGADWLKLGDFERWA